MISTDCHLKLLLCVQCRTGGSLIESDGSLVCTSCNSKSHIIESQYGVIYDLLPESISPSARREANANDLMEVGPERTLTAPYCAYDTPDADVWWINIENLGQILNLLPDRAKTVAELGAGDCWLSGWVATTGRLVYSMDISVSGLHSAGMLTQVRGDFVRVRGLMEELPFADSSMDVIICHGSVHHTSSLHSVLSEIKRVINRSGEAILAEPMRGMVLNRKAMSREAFHRGANCRQIPLREYTDIAKELGLKIEILFPEYLHKMLLGSGPATSTARANLARLAYKPNFIKAQLHKSAFLFHVMFGGVCIFRLRHVLS